MSGEGIGGTGGAGSGPAGAAGSGHGETGHVGVASDTTPLTSPHSASGHNVLGEEGGEVLRASPDEPELSTQLNEATRAWILACREESTPLDPAAPIPLQRAHQHAISERIFARINPGMPDGLDWEEHATTSGVPLLLCQPRRKPRQTEESADENPNLRPVLLYIHGGGFWQGSAGATLDRVLVARRALDLGALVVSVDYRLSPEATFPAALDDIDEAVAWIHVHAQELRADASTLVIDGISAGASIAMATCLRAAGQGRKNAAGFVLEVPIGDMRNEALWVGKHAALNGLEELPAMYRMYAGAEPLDNPLLSPVLATSFAGMPPTHVMTAEYDPLRDAGEELARLMRVAGVSVTGTRHLGALHGSSGLAGIEPVSQAWHDDVCAAVRRMQTR